MRGRTAGWIALALLLGGCAGPGSRAAGTAPAATDQTDIWFMQHMVPHLWRQTSIASLTRAHLTHPEPARLAETMTRRNLADIGQLQAWLSLHGLAPHGHSHQRVDNRQQTDLERLTGLGRDGLDLAFLDVMTARDRAGIAICAAELRRGTHPQVRQLAERMLTDQQRRLRRLRAWKHAWSTASSRAGA